MVAGNFRFAHRNGFRPQRKEQSMLSLTRRIREEIIVIDRQTGEQIVIAPIGYRGNQVKIGIEASKTRFTILRREVLERDGTAALT
jgi:sRNA-binding carbon storage regulator CsrA